VCPVHVFPRQPSGKGCGSKVKETFDEHFDVTDTAEIDAMIDQLKNGDVKKNGFILSDKTNLDKYFTDLEVLRTEIYNYAVRNGAADAYTTIEDHHALSFLEYCAQTLDHRLDPHCLCETNSLEVLNYKKLRVKTPKHPNSAY